MVVLAGGVGTLGGRAGIVVTGVRVGVVGASSMTMSVKGGKRGGVLKHGKERRKTTFLETSWTSSTSDMQGAAAEEHTSSESASVDASHLTQEASCLPHARWCC